MTWQPIETAPKDGRLLRLWIVPIGDDLSVPAPTTGEQKRRICFGQYPRAIDSFWDQKRQDAYDALCREAGVPTPDFCGWDGFGPNKYRPTHCRPADEPPVQS